MTVTVIVLYDDSLCEHYVGVVHGSLSDEQKRDIAKQFDAIPEGDEGAHEEDARTIGFREVEVADSADSLRSLGNIWKQD